MGYTGYEGIVYTSGTYYLILPDRISLAYIVICSPTVANLLGRHFAFGSNEFMDNKPLRISLIIIMSFILLVSSIESFSRSQPKLEAVLYAK